MGSYLEVLVGWYVLADWTALTLSTLFPGCQGTVDRGCVSRTGVEVVLSCDLLLCWMQNYRRMDNTQYIRQMRMRMRMRMMVKTGSRVRTVPALVVLL